MKHQFLNDSIIEGDESCVSSMSDISINSKRMKWVGKHSRQSCLHCCRSRVNRLHPRTDSDMNILKIKSVHSSSIQLSDVSFNSPESVFSEESMPDRITANILRHVQRMSNPVWSKQSKMALLELKQKHPGSFQDICLYSEVCKSLGRCTYRMNARRFLQELFLDLDFDGFFNEASEIIARKDSMDSVVDEIDGASVRDIAFDATATTSNDNTPSTSSATLQYQPAIHLIKAHLKSPPLESVYEASAENLSESFGSKSKIKSPSSKNVYARENLNENSMYHRRERFYSLELDLSCTKNKFPITDRRKTFSPTLSSNSIFSQAYNTKSLSSSVTTPTGSLFCEKRIESSKSEATLSHSKKDKNDNNDKKDENDKKIENEKK